MGLFLRKTARIHNCYVNDNAISDWLMCKPHWLTVTRLTLLHKGIEGTTSWHEFWLSLARQIQKRSYLTDRQSFKRLYTENGASSKKGKRTQQSSVSTKPTLVDMEKSHRSAVQWNKHCKPPPEPGRIHLEIYTVRRQFTGTLWNLWMATYSTGPAQSSRLRRMHVHTLWPVWTNAKQNPWVLQSW